MGRGLLVTVPDIINCYVDVINHAKKDCIICTPYYQSIPEIENAIYSAINRGVKFWIYCRMGEEELFKPLENNSSILLTNIEYLHGKVILNETEMIVSSLNFTECSMDNYEFAFHTDDLNELQKMKSILKREFDYGLDMTGKPLDMNNPFMSCKCGMTLPRTPNMPMCPNCYRESKGLDRISFNKYSKCKKCSAQIINDPCNPYPKPYCYKCWQQLSPEEKENLKYASCKSCGRKIPNDPYRPYCLECWKKRK